MKSFDVSHKDNNRLGRNLQLCVAIAWLGGGLGVVLPNLMLFWKARGITLEQVWVLQGVFALTVAMCTVPFGYLADRKGRKLCMLCGVGMQLLGDVAYVLGDSFWPLLVGEVLMGFGMALVSGADSALLYDTLLARGEKELAARWSGLSAAGMFLFTAIASLVGGAIAQFDDRLPFAVAASCGAAQLVLVLFVKEPTPSGEDKLVRVRQLPQVFCFCFQPGSYQRWLIVAFSVTTVATWLAVWFYPLCFAKAGLTVGQQGAIFAAYNIVAASGALWARWQKGQQSITRMFLAFLAMSALAHVVLGSVVAVWVVLFGMLHQIVRGAAPVVFGRALNDHTPSSIRATVSSVQGAISTLLYGGLNLRLGACVQRFGYGPVLVAIGIGCLAAALCIWALYPKRQQQRIVSPGA